jgi:hypothetical protein
VDLSRFLKRPLVPVFPNGRLPTDDPLGRQIAARLIESLIPNQSDRPGIAGLILPGDPITAEAGDPLYSFVQRLLALRGYRTLLVNAGAACVLTELEHRGFNGIGVSVGASSTSLSMALNGRALWQGAVRRGCQQTDEAFARSRGRFLFDSEGKRYLDLDGVARWRSTSSVNLAAPCHQDEELLQTLIREWLNSAFRELSVQMSDAMVAAGRSTSFSMVVAGGPARMKGFDHLVDEAVRRTGFPVRIDEIRNARPCEFTLARGCLLAAELESRPALRAA